MNEKEAANTKGFAEGYAKGHKDGIEAAKKAIIALADVTYGKGDK